MEKNPVLIIVLFLVDHLRFYFWLVTSIDYGSSLSEKRDQKDLA